jgi:hypothetical protein
MSSRLQCARFSGGVLCKQQRGGVLCKQKRNVQHAQLIRAKRRLRSILHG